MGNGRVKGKEKGRGGEGRKGNRVRGKRKKGWEKAGGEGKTRTRRKGMCPPNL